MRVILTCCVLCLVAVTAQERPRIVMDGSFEDWTNIRTVVHDPPEAARLHLDFRELRAFLDGQYLSLYVQFERAVNILAAPGVFSVALNVDGDEQTGEAWSALAGTDLVIDISGTSGVKVRRPPFATSKPESAGDQIGFVFAPVYLTNQLEMHVRRDALGTSVLGNDNRTRRVSAKLAYLEKDLPGDEAAPVDLGWTEIVRPQAENASSTSDPLVRAAETSFRVVTWNVSGLPIAKRDAFSRIFRALDADVLLLSQVPPFQGPVLLQWLSQSGPAGGEPWQVVLPNVLVRSDATVAFAGLPYPREAPKNLADLYFPNQPAERDAKRAALEKATTEGRAAVARWSDRRLLTVHAHLYPGGNAPDDPREMQRLIQAQSISDASRVALGYWSPHGVIVGGDLNLVGTRRPVDILMQGLDIDGSSLRAVDALQFNGRSNATWRGATAGSTFPPGRLDWLLYSDSSLEVLKGFVFDTETMPTRWLTAYGLEKADSSPERTSDHLPVVADFRWRK